MHSAGQVEAEDVVVGDDRAGPVVIRIYRPSPHRAPLPTLIYVRGDEDDGSDELARRLAASTDAAVAIPQSGLSSSAGSAVAIERCYAATAWTARNAAPRGLDGKRIAVGGDRSGARLAAGLTQLASQRGGPALLAQVLLCPTFAAPPQPGAHELRGLPPALVITTDSDGGETYAAALVAAGVPVVAVRYQGAGPGFMTSDPLEESPAAIAALARTTQFLVDALKTCPPAGVQG